MTRNEDRTSASHAWRLPIGYRLAAAPTFAIMALLTATFGGGPTGYALLGQHMASPLERNGPDVRADERLPFDALAEARLQATQRYSPVLIPRLPKRSRYTAILRRLIGTKKG